MSFWLVKIISCVPGCSKDLLNRMTYPRDENDKTDGWMITLTGGFVPSSLALTASMDSNIGLLGSQSIHIAYSAPRERRMP